MQRTPPLVSVILATYNRAHLIRRAIDSVLEQTLQDFEFLIIDDGSTDATEQVVSEYRDPRIHYEKIAHGERSRARNHGASISRGKYLAFLDSDDWYLPNKLEAQSAALEKNPECGLALGGWRIVNETGQTIVEMKPWEHLPRQPIVEDWLLRGTATPITVLVRREWYEQVGGFDPALSFSEDVDLWIRLTLAGCKSIWTREAIATVLVHGTNSLRDYERVKQGRRDFLEKIFSLPGIQQIPTLRKEDILAQFQLNLAWLAISENHPEKGMEELENAAAMDPSLRAQDGAKLRASLIDYSQYFLVDDPLRFAELVFQHLPASLHDLRPYRGAVMAQVALSQGWRANRNGNRRLAGQYMLDAVRFSPAQLRNRGVLSILVKSFFAGAGKH